MLKLKMVMKMKNKKRAILTPLILSFIGGFLDIYSLMYRGGHFTFLQTGNLIYLARDLINNDYDSVLICLFIFLSFSVGLIIANIISYIFKIKKKEYLINLILLMIVFISIIPNYFFIKTTTFDISYIGVFSLGIIGGILLESFRFSYLAYTATMMTNNYKMFMHSLINGILLKEKEEKNKALIYFLIILAFIIGVLFYTLCYKYDIIIKYIVFIPQLLIFILICFEIYKIKESSDLDEK